MGCAFSLGLLLHVSVGSIKHACSKTMKCVGSKRWPLGALTHPQPNLSEQNVLGDRVDDRVASRAQTLGEEGSAEAEAAATAAEAMPPTPPYIPPPRAAEAATAADAMVELSETQKHEDMDEVFEVMARWSKDATDLEKARKVLEKAATMKWMALGCPQWKQLEKAWIAISAVEEFVKLKTVPRIGPFLCVVQGKRDEIIRSDCWSCNGSVFGKPDLAQCFMLGFCLCEASKGICKTAQGIQVHLDALCLLDWHIQWSGANVLTGSMGYLCSTQRDGRQSQRRCYQADCRPRSG